MFRIQEVRDCLRTFGNLDGAIFNSYDSSANVSGHAASVSADGPCLSTPALPAVPLIISEGQHFKWSATVVRPCLFSGLNSRESR